MARVQEFNFDVDLLQVLLWQSNQADTLQTLIQGLQDWTNTEVSTFWVNWFSAVFDLKTADDFGLTVWAIILGVPLYYEPAPVTTDVFGFGPDDLNFENGGFGVSAGSTQLLTTEQRRIVLRLRAYQLLVRPTVPNINAMLADVFADLGPAYVVDNNDMTLTYVFQFSLPFAVREVIDQFDLLLRPAGVGISYLINPVPGFGFGPDDLNFENGNFYYGGT